MEHETQTLRNDRTAATDLLPEAATANAAHRGDAWWFD